MGHCNSEQPGITVKSYFQDNLTRKFLKKILLVKVFPLIQSFLFPSVFSIYIFPFPIICGYLKLFEFQCTLKYFHFFKLGTKLIKEAKFPKINT